MASPRDRDGGKARRLARPEAKRTHRPTEKAKRAIQKLDRERGISAEMAAQLQAQWGNQAVAQLLDLPTAGAIAATASERRELGEDEEELLDRLDADQEGPRLDGSQSGGLAPATLRGLPTATAAGGQDREFGGDDDDEPIPLPDDPDGTPLRFDRSGRGNLARLQDLREGGALDPAQLGEARGALSRAGGAAQAGPQAAMGDALFHAPMEAWEDASLIAGRGCGMDELQDLAGPYDALGRPLAVGAFTQRLATTPIGRSLARLCANAPGGLLPVTGGLAGAAARLGALAMLGQAADGLHRGSLRDRALRIALSQAALELVLLSAGDVAESVPPAHTLYRRITGHGPGSPPPERAPGPVACHWVVPALRSVGQLLPLPTVRRWHPPRPTPTLDPDDPMSVVDAALYGAGPGAGEQTAARADLRPLLDSVDALLAAGGRAQVELATAALASRRAGFDGMIAATLRRAYRAFRATALELVEARRVLAQAHEQPVAVFEAHLLRANDEIEALRDGMDRARERCLADLAVICELG